MNLIHQLIPNSFLTRNTLLKKASFRLITSDRDEYKAKEIELFQLQTPYRKETFKVNSIKYYSIEW